jgi:ribulose-5-phosphate 4-epimerase/fuculose-1-phosphate aldolase
VILLNNLSSKVSRTLKVELVQGALKVAQIGLVPLTQGNLSLRDPETGLILVTPHDHPYETMTPDDIVVVDLAGTVVDGARDPSAEVQVHLAVYEKRPEVMGIVHAEPVYTNAFGVVHREILPVHVGMALDVGGAVPIMPFEPSGSRIFGYHMLEVMGDKNAVIWANHGMMAVGDSLKKAIHCTVMVEMTAKIYFLALQIGEPKSISEGTLQSLIG